MEKLKEKNKLNLFNITRLLDMKNEKDFIHKLESDIDYRKVFGLISSISINCQEYVYSVMEHQIINYLKSDKNECEEILIQLFSGVKSFIPA